MKDLGLFVEKKFIVETGLPFDKAAELLMAANDSYTAVENIKQRGEWYVAKIIYRDINRWILTDVWLEKHVDGILFHILTMYRDGKSERHLLNDISRVLEERLLAK
ncbi:MAG: hypothetical protein HY438_00845 [DPANN group archaeon]|nr:hypothetical protein [DPANN group archaeon]